MVTTPSGMPHVATTRPSTSATGRKMPLLVTTPPCDPTNGSRDAHPCSSGSNGPSNRGDGNGAALVTVDEDHVLVVEGLDLVGDRTERAPRIPERDAGPLREVTRRCRTVTREVAASEPRERVVAIERERARARASPTPRRTRDARRPSARERRARAGSPRTGGARVPAPRSGCRPRRAAARSCSRVCGPSDVTASPMTSTPRTACASLTPSCARRRRFPCGDPWRRQRMQPPVVGGAYEVQRAAVEPRDDD